MSQVKTKIEILLVATKAAQHLGILLMTAASIAGIFEFHDRIETRAVLTAQPVLAVATGNFNQTTDQAQRKEREDIGTHYVSYAENQRTPSRSGKF